MKNLTILTLLFALGCATMQAQYKVIVNNSNSSSSISTADLSNIFLKKKVKWADNTPIDPVDLSSKSAVRASFSKAVLKKDVSQVRAFWQQSVFAGKATPPREMKDDNEVINYVKSTRGAIGYVSSGANTDGVKTISVN